MAPLLIAAISFAAGYWAMPTPEPVQVIVDHKIEVNIPCKIHMPEKPIMPLTDTAKAEDDIFLKTKKALAETELRKGYEDKLEAAAGACK